MCGFSLLAFVGSSPVSRSDYESAFDRLEHRGRDGHDVIWKEHFWAGHHRLAFQDKAKGGQPMRSSDGKWWIVFNGEIYNHFELRRDLERKFGTQFQTRSDTETLVEWIAAHDGFDRESWDLLEGEFAFVAVRNDGTEILSSRDAFGVKPLFLQGNIETDAFAVAKASYDFHTQSLCFASEMKGLPSPLKFHRDGFLRQFVGLYEPLRTPFEGVVSLAGGHLLSAKKTSTGFQCQLNLWESPIRKNAKHTRDALEPGLWFRKVFEQSVEDRLLSDVELGVYLSGGIDSRAVAFELQNILRRTQHSSVPQNPKSFTVGFEDASYDETNDVLAYAKSFGFESQVLKLNQKALEYAYPIAVFHSENIQPYTNGAAKWWLSQLARRSVRGVITGDGADELLCGYPSFRYAAWWKFQARGGPWRKSVYQKKYKTDAANPWVAGLSSAGEGSDFRDSLALWSVPHPLFGQIKTITQCLLGTEKEALNWLKAQGESVKSWFEFGFKGNMDTTDSENALLCWQNYFCKTHLPVQVLNWVGDRMEMAGNLEGRTPFLSRKIRKALQDLPDVSLVAGFQDKAILRRAYSSSIGSFAKAPKKQFGAPFLGSELARHSLEAAFADLGMSNKTFQQNLESLRQTSPEFDQTHINSAWQTALSLGVVHSSLVRKEPLAREVEWEENFLSNATSENFSLR